MISLKHFKPSEFDSPDAPGSGVLMDEDFLLLLDLVRDLAGISFKINSGYRTVAQNKKDGGKIDSAHLVGKAADIAAPTSTERFLIVGSAISKGIRRIGIGKTFVHLDNDLSLPNPVIWLY